MYIGLHDAELEHIRNKKFPNYALMKIAAYHKALGDTVEMFIPNAQDEQEQISFFKIEDQYPPKRDADIYDIVYSSKIFDFTPSNPYLPTLAIRGGTGYSDISIDRQLPPEIDRVYPDYSLYPDCDYAIGYLTRGCPNHCPWCLVFEKEGDIYPYREWRDLVRPDSNKLVLMDNNILASNYGIEQLVNLIGSGFKIDLNQGMDARLVSVEVAEILARLNWIRFIRFSCDQISQIDAIMRAAELLEQHGKKPYNLFIYLLVTEDIEDAAYRVQHLKKLKGVSIYAQPERNGRAGVIPNMMQKEFAQRYIYGRSYLKESWSEYLKRNNML